MLERAVREGGGGGQVEELGELLQLLQLALHVVQQVLVLLAAPGQLQLLQVTADGQQLPGQLLVLCPHLQLKAKRNHSVEKFDVDKGTY